MNKVQNLQEKDLGLEDLGLKKKKRSRKVIGEEGSRKQTAIGLLATIVLSLMFYLPTQLKEWWEGLGSSEVITIEKPVGDTKDVSEVIGFKLKIREKQDIKIAIEQLLENLSGRYGVYVKNLKNGEKIMMNESEDYGAASVAKLLLLVNYYQAVDNQKIDPETVYRLKEKDRWEYGTGSMQNQPVGTEYSYKEVAYLVANQSDNMGAIIMSGWVGHKMAEELSPKEVGEMLEQIEKGELLSKESKEELFKNLTNTVNEDRITAGVPSGVRVVHKFGSETGVVNDCGVVYGESTYVICIMTDEVNDGEAQEVLPKISRVVWEWIVEVD